MAKEKMTSPVSVDEVLVDTPSERQQKVKALERRVRRLRAGIVALTVLQFAAWVVAGVILDRIFDLDSTVEDFFRVALPVLGAALSLMFLVTERKRDALSDLQSLNVLDGFLAAEAELVEDVRAEVVQAVGEELAEVKALLPFMDMYFAAAEQDPYDQRTNILKVARGALKDLAEGRMLLVGDEYYDWLRDRLSKYRLATVLAISVRPLLVYKEDNREAMFIANNKDAVRDGGVAITRLLIVTRQEILDKENRDILDELYLSPVNCALVWQEQLPAEHLKVLRGGGLSIYDTEEVFHDESYFAQDFQEDIGRAGTSDDLGHTKRPVPQACVHRKSSEAFEKLRVLAERVNEYVLTGSRVTAPFTDDTSREAEARKALHVVRRSLLTWAEAPGRNVDPGTLSVLRDEVLDGASQ